MTQFSENAIKIIGSIPAGRIASYGRVAEMAGNPRGARQVSRLLHSSSGKYQLPWHRVVSADGKISLTGEGGDIQRQLLEAEGIEIGLNGKIDIDRYGI